jgi:hypothetical protein
MEAHGVVETLGHDARTVAQFNGELGTGFGGGSRRGLNVLEAKDQSAPGAQTRQKERGANAADSQDFAADGGGSPPRREWIGSIHNFLILHFCQFSLRFIFKIGSIHNF